MKNTFNIFNIIFETIFQLIKLMIMTIFCSGMGVILVINQQFIAGSVMFAAWVIYYGLWSLENKS